MCAMNRRNNTPNRSRKTTDLVTCMQFASSVYVHMHYCVLMTICQYIQTAPFTRLVSLSVKHPRCYTWQYGNLKCMTPACEMKSLPWQYVNLKTLKSWQNYWTGNFGPFHDWKTHFLQNPKLLSVFVEQLCRHPQIVGKDPAPITKICIR